MEPFKEIWYRYQKGVATSSEKKILLNQIEKNSEGFQDMLRENWENANFDSGEITERRRTWNFIESKLGFKPSKALGYFYYGIAASLVILASLSFYLFHYYQNQFIRIETAAGEAVKEFMLPDGTVVWLNHESSVSYPKNFAPDIREIELIGNAYLDVSKDPERPFQITAGAIQIQVLGTSFDVSSYEYELPVVSVNTGKVRVTHAGSKSEITLVANEQANYDPELQRLTKANVRIENFISWRQDILSFDNLTFGAAIKKIERKYNVTINCKDPELMKTKIRAEYRNEPLDSVLSDLTFLTNSTYTMVEQKLISITPNKSL